MAALVVAVMVVGCGASRRDEASTEEAPAPTSTAAAAVVPASTKLSFTMPASGHALYLSNTESGVRVFDIDDRQIGEFEGLQPQMYYGPADGVVVQRDDGLWLARPGANELVSAPLTHSSGTVLPGWQLSGSCHTNPKQPLVAICGKEIQVRDSNGRVEATIHAPNLPAGRWIGASLSPDGEWVGANWQGQCEVVWGFVANVRDGTPIAVTENAFGPAPSGFVTWLDTGEAVGTWRQDGSCGELDLIGVYRFRPLEQPRLWFTTTGAFAVW